MDASGKSEIKKVALRQTDKGTIVSFLFHHGEDNSEMNNAPIGQSFYATFEPIED